MNPPFLVIQLPFNFLKSPLRASIYGKKKFKFLLALLDPKNQQKSIQYLQSGKKTLNYSSLDPPYFDQFVPSLKMLIFGGKIW